MTLRIVCPRCQGRLAVAARMAGTYGLCPRCQARLWIPADKETECTALIPAPQRSAAVTSSVRPSGNGQSSKMARFVTAELACAPREVIGETVLPVLRLHESATEASATKVAGVNPLVTISLLCLSAVASIVVLLLPDQPAQTSRSVRQHRARAVIEKEYFAELGGRPDFTYQLRLREALRAFHRGDHRRERDLYREVLTMLHAESTRAKGVSGSPRRDRELERHLEVLLSD